VAQCTQLVVGMCGVKGVSIIETIKTKFYDIYIYIYIGCFKTWGNYCRRWFPRSLWSRKFI